MSVNTAKVTGRRELHFEKLEDIYDDAARLATGNVRQLGNWTLAQNLKHLTDVMHQSIDGESYRVAWPIRIVAKLFLKKRILHKGMLPGFKIPRPVAPRIEPAADISNDEALQGLREAIDRLNTTDQRKPNMVFGPMTRQEWNLLHLRHAELHLSFIVPA